MADDDRILNVTFNPSEHDEVKVTTESHSRRGEQEPSESR
jgi:hypothetical protein